MNVQELYQQKLTTAEEAVKIVKSGDWVDYGYNKSSRKVPESTIS